MIVEYDFIAFFLKIMLEEHFHTKSAMARALGLHLRTIQTTYNRSGSAKGACLAFERSVCYCYDNGISVDAIYETYILQKTDSPVEQLK